MATLREWLGDIWPAAFDSFVRYATEQRQGVRAVTTAASTTPLTKQAAVPCEPAQAFERFTKQMSAWWPRDTHSVAAASTGTVVVQEGVGGHIVETLPDGAAAIWGTIRVSADRAKSTYCPST